MHPAILTLWMACTPAPIPTSFLAAPQAPPPPAPPPDMVVSLPGSNVELAPVGDYDDDGVPELALLGRTDRVSRRARYTRELRWVVSLDGSPPLPVGDGDLKFATYAPSMLPTVGPVDDVPSDVDGDGIADIVVREWRMGDCLAACNWPVATEDLFDTFEGTGPSPEELDSGWEQPAIETGQTCARTCDIRQTRFTILYGGRQELGSVTVPKPIDEHLLLDVNGDGADDLVLRHRDDLAWIPSEGGQFLRDPEVFARIDELGLEDHQRDVPALLITHAGDTNGDGRSDLLVRSADYMGYDWFLVPDFAVLYGTADGPELGWRMGDLVPTDGNGISCSGGLGDVDGDGYDDVATYSYANGGGGIVFGGPAGPGRILWTAECPHPIGDFNGDGFDDVYLYAGEDLADPISTSIRFGSPTGLVAMTMSAVGRDGVGDVDGDGRDDLARVMPDPSGDLGRIEVWITLGRDLAGDSDSDGMLDAVDCAPLDYRVAASFPEVPGNLIDEDCDGVWSCGVDADGDRSISGFLSQNAPCLRDTSNTQTFDCDDADRTVFPDLYEVMPDGLDRDCDGLIRCRADSDGDGYPHPSSTTEIAAAVCPTFAGGAFDCDDEDAAVHPGQVDDPTALGDVDCDGVNWCYPDNDRDGTPIQGPLVSQTTPCRWFLRFDCDDADPTRRFDAGQPLGSPIDRNCDGLYACYVDDDGDGFFRYTSRSTTPCAAVPEPLYQDCDDNRAHVYPGAPSVPGLPSRSCWIGPFEDADGDGVGGVAVPLAFVGPRSAFDGDCDDADRDVAPGLNDPPGDGIDGDCDGSDPFHLRWGGGRSVRVEGVPSGARWWLAAATAQAQPCTPVAAGLCVDLAAPALIAQGTGPGTVTLPAGRSGYVQAVSLVRGEAWRTAVLAVP